MRYIIRIKDGEPYWNPIQEDNFIMSYPNIDIDNLPSEFEEFIKSDPPIIGVYDKELKNSYKKVNNKWTEVWELIPFTNEEKIMKQDMMKLEWEIHGKNNFMIFDEKTCTFKYPIPYPHKTGKKYIWSEIENNWIEGVKISPIRK